MPDAHSAGCQIVEILDIRYQALQEVLCILFEVDGDDWLCLADLEDVMDV